MFATDVLLLLQVPPTVVSNIVVVIPGQITEAPMMFVIGRMVTVVVE